MYIEMVDETGQVSEEIIKQTHDIREFAAKKIGKEEKEMAQNSNPFGATFPANPDE